VTPAIKPHFARRRVGRAGTLRILASVLYFGLAQQGHLGLAGLRERAALVGGQMSVRSVPGQGAQVTVSVIDRP
jgi:signal transduction histidine kinase